MPTRQHSSHCECRACLCDCGAYECEPWDKCHPDCLFRSIGRMSEHEYPPAYEYRITYF